MPSCLTCCVLWRFLKAALSEVDRRGVDTLSKFLSRNNGSPSSNEHMKALCAVAYTPFLSPLCIPGRTEEPTITFKFRRYFHRSLANQKGRSCAWVCIYTQIDSVWRSIREPSTHCNGLAFSFPSSVAYSDWHRPTSRPFVYARHRDRFTIHRISVDCRTPECVYADTIYTGVGTSFIENF